MREAYICDFTRSPIGRYAGALSHVRADDLAAHPIRALRERHPNIDWAALDDCFMGCANQAGEDNRNVARMAVLLAGLPVSAPGTTINRLCGSGLDAVGQAARAIKAGEADLVLAGGVESMSRAPFVMPKATNAFSRDNAVYDTTIGWRFVNPALKELWGCASMPETGENVAAKFNISRADQDAFALRSQQNAEKARLAGYFSREITPIKVTVGRIESLIETDEHPRPETTSESLARLKAPFRKEGGTVTAGNASGVNDGAACLILASEKGIRRFGLTPRARVVAMATAGLEPDIMGYGPVAATQRLLARTGRSLSDVDLVELNEAFASQSLAVMRGLSLPDDCDKVNPHGGAIALGHPLGMSGARLAMTAINGLEQRQQRTALVTMCIGVGQGIAALIDRV